jgi:geranylgeranyl pyrophosphate synthase
MTKRIDFEQQLSDKADRVNKALHRHFASSTDDIHRLDAAIRYAVLDAGKRLRPSLVYAVYEALASSQRAGLVTHFAMAVECIHCYSLIHDDLPDMDDDALRRGKPTTHIAFDSATAILAGDALQAEAFNLIATAPEMSDSQKISAVSCLSQSAGKSGMVGGQQIDMNQQVNTLSELEHMHNSKTGALITAACELGAIAAEADNQTLTILRTYSQQLGLLFQIKDDLLDVLTNTEILGKQQGADALAGKATYVSLLGVETAQKQAEFYQNASKETLRPLAGRYDIEFLCWLVDKTANRNH